MADTYFAKDEVTKTLIEFFRCSHISETFIKAVVEQIPPADVVEVVRCKDCCKRDVCRTSTVWAVAPKDDWFCADGYRRADNG